MKKIKICLTILLLCSLLLGCESEAVTIQPPALVTQVQVTAYVQDDVIHRTYTSPEKMDVILRFLRLLKPYGKSTEDPERLAGRRFVIRVERSDGVVRTYRFIADRYYSALCRRWQKIEPYHCSELFFLILHLKSDDL